MKSRSDKIAISIIVGERHEEFERCLKSAEGMYDYISCTIVKHKGADIVDTYNIAHKYGAIINIYAPEWDEPFIDDFSAARNMSIDNIPADTDWIICLDSDDILVTDPMNYLRYKDPCVIAVIIIGDKGNFIQNRIWHHSLGIRWEGRLHEELIAGDTEIITIPNIQIKHTRHSLGESRTRNMAIGKDIIDSGTATTRDKFYHAENVYYSDYNESVTEDMESTIPHFEEVLLDEDIAYYYRYTSALHIAEISFLKASKDKVAYKQAIINALSALAINPTAHDPYYLMGLMMFNVQMFDLAAGWFNHCLSLPTDITRWKISNRHEEARQMLQRIEDAKPNT